jgi:phosphoglycolate phosphatase-like HAD superfamily hydrolase
MSPPLLILFDIDGTLLLSGGAGVRGLNRAFGQLHGRDSALDGVSLAGRTDRAIVIDLLRAIGREPDEPSIAALRDRYCEHLAIEIARPGTGRYGVLPGVQALLDDLDARADVPIGLLTGNFRRGAEIKLGHFDLWGRFSFGAFGDDHVDRRALLPIALERAQDAGIDVPSMDRVLVVGDTPLDVDCARAHGARAVAVATGPFTKEQLAETGADVVLDTLQGWDATVARSG